MTEKLKSILSKRVLVIDGAMGTEIQKNFSFGETEYRGSQFKDHSKDLKGNSDVLCITQPKAIQQIHESYIEAGADIIETCTFGATSIVQKEYGLEKSVREMNIAAVRVAKAAAAKYDDLPVFVAGSIGPTSLSASTAVDMENRSFRLTTFDELATAYLEQVDALVEAGVDILLVETCFDTLNAKAAVFAINTVLETRQMDIPVFVSGTLEISGRNLSGSDAHSFYASVMHCRSLFSIGLNCSLGPEEMMPHIALLSEKVPNHFVHLYPNAGMPDGDGNYELTPLQLKEQIRNLLKKKLTNIIGGCCGTTPGHIKELKSLALEIETEEGKVREVRHGREGDLLTLAGYNVVRVADAPDKIISIGERCNVFGSQMFKKAMEEANYDKGATIALKQLKDGADAIDVNVDDSMIDEEEMGTFVNVLLSEPEIAKVVLCIDSSEFSRLLKGLKKVPGRPLVNSISLQHGEEDFIGKAKLLRSIGCVPVIMAFDENGQGDTEERKIEILTRSAEILKSLGYDESDFVVDPAVLPIATGIPEHNEFGVSFLNTVEKYKKRYPRSSVIAGVSNVSFALRGANAVRKVIHGLFLKLTSERGLNTAIINPLHVPPELKRRINFGDVNSVVNTEDRIHQLCSDLLMNRGDVVKAREEVLEISEEMKRAGSGKKPKEEASLDNLSDGELIRHAVLKGDRLTNLQEVLDRLINSSKNQNPMVIVDDYLMPAIGEVGELFGRGEMYLPQVLKSAYVMKESFDYLLPKLRSSGSEESVRSRRIILASVKGDIHNLGKRIVAVILQCNNFEVKDIGESVDADTIINSALEWKADAIGLSGLINPSLNEMAIVARQMESRKLTIPLLIGGAATSGEHTAVKIAPEYPNGTVLRVKDGSECVKVLSQKFSEEYEVRLSFASKLVKHHEMLRKHHTEKQKNRRTEMITLKNARERYPNNILHDDKWIGQLKISRDVIGQVYEVEAEIGDLQKRFPWVDFFRNAFSLNIRDPDSPAFREAKALEGDIEKVFAKFKHGRGLVGIFKAKVQGTDDIALYDAEGKEVGTFYGVRRQVMRPISEVENVDGRSFECISECLVGGEDYVGVFAGTTGVDLAGLKSELPEGPYWEILVESVVNHMAEAFSEYLHEVACVKYAGFPEISGVRPAFGYGHQPDHSEKVTCWKILDVENRIGIKLTETYQMHPEASVSGLYFMHPDTTYFSVGQIGDDQISDYAARKGIPEELARRFLVRT